MAGVTHFEKRAQRGPKKVHPQCPFCEKTWRVTSREVSKRGGPARYVDQFRDHLFNELEPYRVTKETVSVAERPLLVALDSMAHFAVMVYDNC